MSAGRAGDENAGHGQRLENARRTRSMGLVGAGATSNGRRTPFANDKNQNPNISNICSSGLDNYVPTIRRVNESNIKTRFKMQHLAPINGKPVFAQIQNLREALTRNALTAKIRLWGGRKDALT